MYIRGQWRIDVQPVGLVWILPDIRGEDELCGKYLAALLRIHGDDVTIRLQVQYQSFIGHMESPDTYYVSPPSMLLHPSDYEESDIIEAATKYMEACKREAHRIGSKYKLRKTRSRRAAMFALRDSYE